MSNAQNVLAELTALAAQSNEDVAARLAELQDEIKKLTESANETVSTTGFVAGGWYIDPETLRVFVYIPKGKFLYGPNKEERTVEKGFFMALNPTTWGEYKKYCEETNTSLPESPNFEYDDTHPVVNVSAFDAEKFADHYGLKIPDEVQWEYAARGTDGREYSWGDEFREDQCVCRTSGTASVFDERNTYSPMGVRGMIGNVWEAAYPVE